MLKYIDSIVNRSNGVQYALSRSLAFTSVSMRRSAYPRNNLQNSNLRRPKSTRELLLTIGATGGNETRWYSFVFSFCHVRCFSHWKTGYFRLKNCPNLYDEYVPEHTYTAHTLPGMYDGHVLVRTARHVPGVIRVYFLRGASSITTRACIILLALASVSVLKTFPDGLL